MDIEGSSGVLCFYQVHCPLQSICKKNYLKLDENNNRKFNNFKELTDIQ